MRPFTNRLVLAAAVLLFGIGGYAGAAGAESALKPSPDAALYAYGYHQRPYPLEPGPHLFVDWRYVNPGHVSYTYRGERIQRDRPEEYGPEINSQVEVHPRDVPTGIRIEVQPAGKLGPVIRNDQPWEFFTPYVTLIHHEGKYLLFYNTTTYRLGRSSEGYMVCYAESEDGLNYRKPPLGQVEFQGSRENNLVLGPGVCRYGIHGPAIFVDPTAEPAERFKAIYQAAVDQATVERLQAVRPESVTPASHDGTALMGAVSPDGIRWRELEEPLMGHVSDTGTTAYWDQRLGRYVGYFRMGVWGRRMIGRAETTDFRRWPRPEMVLAPDSAEAPWVDYYTNGKELYPGTSTMHLMFPMIYHRNLDTSTVRVAASLAGRIWNFLPGGPVLEPGPEGSFDAGCLFPGAGLAEISGDRVILPYSGFAVPHKFPRLGPLGEVAFAVWPKQRLSALVADEEGTFVTNPLSSQGTTLWLNFDAGRNGSVRVEVVGVEERSLAECDTLFGDRLSKQVTWKGRPDLGIDPGESFRLRFRLRGAKLFAFEMR